MSLTDKQWARLENRSRQNYPSERLLDLLRKDR